MVSVGGGVTPKNLMGSALQGSDWSPQGEQPHSSPMGHVSWGRSCSSPLPVEMPFQSHLAAAVLPRSSSHLVLGRDRETPETPSLFHRETQGVAGEVFWEQGDDDAEHSPCSCPTSAVTELLWLPCAGAMNISVPVPSSVC